MNDDRFISIKVDMKNLGIDTTNKQIRSAVEKTMDRLAYDVRDAVKQQLPLVFDRPTPYTMNSLRTTLTKNHNMRAEVWFKDTYPGMVKQHYLEPQVFGGPRVMKRFEQFGLKGYFEPSKYASLNTYGNLSRGLLNQILSALGSAEYKSGFKANRTERSKKRLKKAKKLREFFQIHEGAKHLTPGVYEEINKGGKSYIKPVLIQIRQPSYHKRLRFYEISGDVVSKRLMVVLGEEMVKRGLS